ncbi:TatD family hydrolase [candidate division CSSED10-310 bacterium]|uniref:TatD family hydrolase n=1 Tax=candidate division CSSED10-310 bacterium TaxID=2855610 RepID=A0ABV6YYB8_UNCC1
MDIIDTHTHLCDSVFDRDRGDVLTRAANCGVKRVIAVSENMADARRNLELASRYQEILPAAGLYPTVLDRQRADEMSTFIRLHQHKLAGIGEVGLDYWIVKNEPEREIQAQIFKQFVTLSGELDLPLNIHSRSAGRKVINLLLEWNARKVQLHAFDGKASAALPAVEAGYYFSIPPSVVRSRQKQKLVRQLPLSCLLLETDSPVLGPSPQERNEPANAVIVLDAISEIKTIPRQQVLEQVAENCHRLYGNLILDQ